MPIPDDLFRDPPARLRGAPFWAWNGRLDPDRLLRQVGWFAEMGFGGFMMHARTGLATPYLSAEFLDRVQACVDEAARRGMHAWLYDEDRWPSGFAGGAVTADQRHRVRHLLVTRTPHPAPVLARWAVRHGEDGAIDCHRRLEDGEAVPAGWTAWHGHLVVAEPGSPGGPRSVPGQDDHGTSEGASVWYNGQTYVDVLSPAAIQAFIGATHERYRQAVGAAFGGVVPAIFTDEPQVALPAWPGADATTGDCRLPWTEDLVATFHAAHGSDPLETLPAVLWDAADSAEARWRFWDHIAARFASAYADQLGAWCGRHGLALTGHLMNEQSLPGQVAALGEAMRHYRAFHIPGIDLLCDGIEILTAKQCQSAKHQYGRSDMASELYGVTDWDFPFVGHKAQGDWQAALGVTVRCHHLAWMGMAGEAKRDYPASIFHQSPWWREYRMVEEHFARAAVALSQGRPLVRVAVVHPVESAWLDTGPGGRAQERLAVRDRRCKELLGWLVHGLIDADLIAESLLPTQAAGATAAPFTVGAMAYDVVLVPALATIRSSTLDRLEAFAAAGGTVRFVGDVPALVDARPDGRAQALAARCGVLPWSGTAVLEALAPWREVDLADAAGAPVPGLFHQLRRDGDGRILFVCNSDRRQGHDGLRLRLRGAWRCERLDTLGGGRTPLPSRQAAGWTTAAVDLPAAGHLLLTATPGADVVPATPRPAVLARTPLPEPSCVTLAEPNALLLDRPAWRIGDGAWQAPDEVLRVGNRIRSCFGLGAQNGDAVQPWCVPRPLPVLGRIALRYAWRQELALEGLHLAIGDPQGWELVLDGRIVPSRDDGWWVDEDIRTVPLPALAGGRHELELRRAYDAGVDCERVYLLGDVAVRLDGDEAVLGRGVRHLRWGDWVGQGLPFFCGNVTYRVVLAGDGGVHRLRAEGFAAPLLRVAVDGRDAGVIAWGPWTCDLGRLDPGPHELAITAFGHRRNGFGPVHLARDLPWVGPNAWRTQGADWCDGYRLRPTGILAPPILERLG